MLELLLHLGQGILRIGTPCGLRVGFVIDIEVLCRTLSGVSG